MDEENIRHQLLNIANYNKSSYIVIGYHGRKGAKLYLYVYNTLEM